MNIIVNFFFASRTYGGFGAIIGTQFANACACGTESYFAHKLIGGSFDFFGTLRIIAISCISVLGGYYLMRIIGPEGSYVSNVIISTLFAGLVTAAFYALLKIPEAKKVWQRIQGLFRQSNSAAFTAGPLTNYPIIEQVEAMEPRKRRALLSLRYLLYLFSWLSDVAGVGRFKGSIFQLDFAAGLILRTVAA